MRRLNRYLWHIPPHLSTDEKLHHPGVKGYIDTFGTTGSNITRASNGKIESDTEPGFRQNGVPVN